MTASALPLQPLFALLLLQLCSVPVKIIFTF
jgi:hypothetical protein